MLAQLKKSYRQTQAQAQRDLAAALCLPWATVVNMVVGSLAMLGAVVGLIGLIWGSIAGALLGGVLGYVLCGVGYVLVHLIPTPFAWAARRLGYA